MYGKSIAVLKPANKLTEGLTYELCIDGLNEFEIARFERDSFLFKVSLPADYETPVWLRSPSFTGKHRDNKEFFNENFVEFCVCIDDGSPVFVRTELKDLKSGKIVEYLLYPLNNSLRVGADRYFGEFILIDSSLYEVRFSLMDICGNTNDSLTSAIQFISPSDGDTVALNRSSCRCPEKKAKKVFRGEVGKDESELIVFLIPLLVVLSVLIYGLRDYFNMHSKNQ